MPNRQDSYIESQFIIIRFVRIHDVSLFMLSRFMVIVLSNMRINWASVGHTTVITKMMEAHDKNENYVLKTKPHGTIANVMTGINIWLEDFGHPVLAFSSARV